MRRFLDVSAIGQPLSDHFRDANHAVQEMASAIEELQGELEDAINAIKELTERLEAIEKRTTDDDFGGKQIISGEGEPY